MVLRDAIQNSKTCAFTAEITADYGESIYTFRINCQSDAAGDMTFKVTYPETISGITGVINSEKAGITFDDNILAFEPLIEGQLAPIASPWLMLKTLRSGYIRSCTENSDECLVIIDDTLDNQAVEIYYWLDDSYLPQNVEIIWNEKRVVTLEILDFCCL